MALLGKLSRCTICLVLLVGFIITIPDDAGFATDMTVCEVTLRITNASETMFDICKRFYHKYKPSVIGPLYTSIIAASNCSYSDIHYRWRFFRYDISWTALFMSSSASPELSDTEEPLTTSTDTDTLELNSAFENNELGVMIINATVTYKFSDDVNTSFSRLAYFVYAPITHTQIGSEKKITKILEALNTSLSLDTTRVCDEEEGTLNQTFYYTINTSPNIEEDPSDVVINVVCLSETCVFINSTYLKVNKESDVQLDVYCVGINCDRILHYRWRLYTCPRNTDILLCDNIIEEKLASEFDRTFSFTLFDILSFEQIVLNCDVMVLSDDFGYQYTENRYIVEIIEAPTGKDAIEQVPTGNDITEQIPTGKDAVEQAVTGNGITEQAPTGNGTVEQAPTGNDVIEQGFSGNDTIEQAPTGNDTDEQAPTGNGTVEQAPTGDGTIEQAPTGNDTIERAPTGNGTDEQAPTGNGTVEQAPTDEQAPTGNGTVEQAPTRDGTIEQAPTGNCTIKPLAGYQFITSFTVLCSGWEDDPDLPVKYTVYSNSTHADALMYMGPGPIPDVYFNISGDKESNYSVTVFILFEDALEGVTQLQPLSVQLFPGPSIVDKDTDVLQVLEAFISVESGDSILDNLLDSGDSAGAVQLLSTVSTALNEDAAGYNTINESRTEQRIELRESVVNILADIPVSSVTDISSVTSSLNTATAVHSELSENAQDVALDAYLNIADVFQNQVLNTTVETSESMTILLLNGSTNLLDLQINPVDANVTSSENRTQKVKTSVGKILQVVEKAADAVLDITVTDAPPKLFSTSKMDVVVTKISPENIAGKSLATNRLLDGQQITGSFQLPNDTVFRVMMANISNGHAVGIQLMFHEENPYVWDDSANTVTTPVVNLILKDQQHSIVPSLGQNEPVHLEMSNTGEVGQSDANWYTSNISVISNTTGTYYTLTRKSYIVIRTTLDSNDTRMMTIATNNITLDFTVFVSQNETPTLDMIQTSGFNVSSISGYNSNYIVFDLFSGLNGTGSNVSIGIVPVLNKDFDVYAKSIAKNCTEEQCSVVPVIYMVELYKVSCIYWNTSTDMWTNDGCKVSNLTTLSKIRCECNHLTAFSGSLLVQPNFVDPFQDAVLFLTFFSNPIVVTTVVVIWIIYLLILCQVRKIDRKDEEKAGIIVVADNNPDDTYVYQICVVTAWWRNAGTTANVSLYLSGEEGQSARHCLNLDQADSEQLFESGSEDWFVITTPQSLGRLQSLTLWHDNSGKSPSWSLSRIIVMDVQTKESWVFPYGTWIAVDMGSMSTKVDLPSYTEEEITSHRRKEFVFKSSRDLRDGHLWISIISKPSRSVFTRVQRLSCALSLLLTTMLTSIMFHGIPTDDAEDQAKLGDITVSLADIVIGIESSLIMFPINLIILQIFMRIGKKPEKPVSKQCYRPTTDEINSESSLMELRIEEEPKNIDNIVESKEPQEKSAKLLPWWFVYIGWILVISTSMVSSYFVMLYGLMYGPRKSVDWLVSFFTSFFQSAFITQPLKVVAIAVVVTMILKRKQIEIHAHDIETRVDRSEDVKDHVIPDPLDNTATKEVQRKIWLDEQVKQTLIDIILYFTFVAVVLFIIHGHRSILESYRATKTLEDIFINPTQKKDNHTFHKVSTGSRLWEYHEVKISPNLKEYSNWTSDAMMKTSSFYLIGPYRLRQLRVKADSCSFPEALQNKYSIMSTCDDHYWIGDEDTSSYNKSWSSLQTGSVYNGPWSYKSAWDLKTVPFMGKHATYSGGGYVLEVKPNSDVHSERLSQLQNSQWLDKRTRAVFIEFTLFNPNNNLFSVLIFVFEFTNIGAIFPYYQIFTTKLYHYGSELETFVAVCEVSFIIYNLVFTYNQIKLFRKIGRHAYFQEFWSYIEIIQIVLSYSIIGLFFQRMIAVNNVIDELKRSDDNTYISFYPAITWDYILTYITAILAGIIIMKIFKLLKFNKRMFMIVQILKEAKCELISFMVFTSIFIFGFAHFAVLTFSVFIYGYRGIGHTLITLFNFFLGVSDFYALREANRIFGPLFYFLFVMFINFGLVTIFISIINLAIAAAKSKASESNPELHVVDYMWSRVKSLV